METKPVKKQQANLTLPELHRKLLVKDDNYYMTMYAGPLLDDECLKEQIDRINDSFPQAPPRFFKALIRAIIEEREEWTNQRLIDAVRHMEHTYKYQQPTLAEILGYNQTIKLLTWEQKRKLVEQDETAEDRYLAIVVEGRELPLWAHINDIKKHGLKLKNK